jgi:hypothetical protein
MAFINFEVPDPQGKGYVREAINTDFVLRAYYDATAGEATIHLTYEGETSKYYKGSKATDIYQHIQALPNFVEASRTSPRGAGGLAVDLLNLNYALHLFYREKDDPPGAEDGAALLRIDYGMSKEITDRSTTPSTKSLTESGRSLVLRGDEAEAVWNKYQGTAI